MKIGYARVSTKQQELHLQLDALNKYGCDIIHEDHGMSGAKHRPVLEACLTSLKAGDTLIVWKFDRLGRTAFHLTRLIQELTERGIFFVSLTQGFDTSTPSGKFMSTVMAGAAEYERDVLIERINAGIQAAKARGIHCGRTRKLTQKQVELLKKLYESGQPVRTLATEFHISIPNVYRSLRLTRAR